MSHLQLPVFDYPLHNGICSEAVPTVDGTQDSFPPRLLDMDKTSPNECDSSSLRITVLHKGGECLESYSIRVRSVLVRIYFCLPMTYKIHLWIKRCAVLSFLIVGNTIIPLWEMIVPTLKWSSKSLVTANGAPITTSDTYCEKKHTPQNQKSLTQSEP